MSDSLILNKLLAIEEQLAQFRKMEAAIPVVSPGGPLAGLATNITAGKTLTLVSANTYQVTFDGTGTVSLSGHLHTGVYDPAGTAAGLVSAHAALTTTAHGLGASAFHADNYFVQPARQVISGAGLSGGGDLSADRTLAVGAGTLITVGADDVGITLGAADYGYIGSTTTPWTAEWKNISSLAGSGLTHSAGVLSVGAGTLITVNADDVAIHVGTAQYQYIVAGASPYTPAWSGGYLNITATKTLAVELDSTVNQDLTTDAGPSFDHIHSTIATGTAPLVVASATVVANLNADMVDGVHGVGTAQYQFLMSGANPYTGAWTLVSALAGAGLTAATGVLAVGAGTGITVNVDDMAVNQAFAFAWTNSHTWADGKQISSSSFASGWTGNGWRVDNNLGEVNKATAEFDTLTVRGRMRVYELLINQIRATNGSIFVSSTGKVKSIAVVTDAITFEDATALTYEDGTAATFETQYTIETDDMHGFFAGDLIRAQRFNGSLGVYQSDLLVTSVTDTTHFIATLLTGSDAPGVGYGYVRLGSASDSTRRGSVYMTADDSNAPYIDIVDGVDSHAAWNSAGVLKARLGRLSGITDPKFGVLSGYGIWTGNGYFTGSLNATAGYIGGVTIAANKIFTGTGLWGNTDTGFYLDETGKLSLRDKLKWDGSALSITGTVTITGGNAATTTYADTVAGTAQSTAISTASGDATTKANSAQGTAISTAAGDATTKANAAALTSTWAGVSGTGKPADDATVGATWGTNLYSIPATLATPSGSGLFLSSTYMGYYASSTWKTYMDNAGNMILGDIAGGNAGLSWNQGTGVLVVKGTLTATCGYVGDWVINVTSLMDAAGVVGMSSAVTGGDDIRFWAGHVTPASAPFKVTEAGVLTASSGTVGGWTLAATTLTSTGVAIRSGATANIAFGSTPPTAANSGTGLYADATGMYGLLSNVPQAVFNAATGAITAGAGNVILDASGIKITVGTGYTAAQSYQFVSGATVQSYLSSFTSASVNSSILIAKSIAYKESVVYLQAQAPSTYAATVWLAADCGASSIMLRLIADSDAAVPSYAKFSTQLFVDGGLNVGTATGAGTGDIKCSGAITSNGGLQTFGAADSAGAGYRLVKVPN